MASEECKLLRSQKRAFSATIESLKISRGELRIQRDEAKVGISEINDGIEEAKAARELIKQQIAANC